MLRGKSLLGAGRRILAGFVVPKAKLIPVPSFVLRRGLVSSQSSGPRSHLDVDEESYQLEKIIKMVEGLLADAPLMKALKLPRSFPFLDDVTKLERKVLDNFRYRSNFPKEEQFNFKKHVLYYNKNNLKDRFGILKYSEMVAKVKEGNLESFYSSMADFSDEDVRQLSNTLVRASGDDSLFFETDVLPIILRLCADPARMNTTIFELFNPTSFYEVVIPMCIYRGKYGLAMKYHKQLMPLIKMHYLEVNWLPIILASLFRQEMEALNTLMKIHFTLDLKINGFFDYIVPYLCSGCRDHNDLLYLVKWVQALIKLGDLPSSSEPHFTNFLRLLLRNKFDKLVWQIFILLHNPKNAETINNGTWASERLLITLMECVNFRQTKDQVLFLKEFISMFSQYKFLQDSEFWFKLIQHTIFRDEETSDKGMKYILLQMSKFGINETYNIHTIKCMRSKSDEQFLMRFDALLNHHELLNLQGINSTIPPKVLAVFLRILASRSPNSFDNCELSNTKLIDESFTMFESYINQAVSAFDNTLKSQRAFLALCSELSKGFLQGLSNSKTVSKYQKIDFISKLESFIYDSLQKVPTSRDLISEGLLINLETNIIRFRLTCGQLDESLERLGKLVENVQNAIPDSTTHTVIDPILSSDVVNVLNSEILSSSKLEDSDVFDSHEISSYNDRNLIKTMKLLIQIYKVNCGSVNPATWSKLVLCAFRLRPYEEVEYFVKWLVAAMIKQQGNKIKMKTSHMLHPLMTIFSPDTVFTMIVDSFIFSSQNERYEPWKTLELILRVSDLTGISLQVPKIKKAVKLGLNKLYVEDHEKLPVNWKRARVKNRLSGEEMIDKFNEVWKTDYFVARLSEEVDEQL